jgi:hypothetical protein
VFGTACLTELLRLILVIDSLDITPRVSKEQSKLELGGFLVKNQKLAFILHKTLIVWIFDRQVFIPSLKFANLACFNFL